MKTSNFSRNSKHPGAVSIAARRPWFYLGKGFPALAPSLADLQAFKLGQMSEQQYSEKFKRQLAQLNPETVHQQLTAHVGSEPVMLCYCKRGAFCHRRIVAEWFEANGLGPVEEI